MIKITNNIKFDYREAPKIIAEISGNHCGTKKKFLSLIESACINGADLIKIQTYEPKDITLNKDYGNFVIKSGIWKNTKLWNLYKKACTPFSWHAEAFKLAKRYNKLIFSSPFSIRAVDHLEKLNCQIYKIASFEITDLKLVNYIASKKKPVIISTGMASLSEIKSAINEIIKFHKKIIILHCISSYPTPLSKINLQKIGFLKKHFKDFYIGLSDHTNDIYSSIAATQHEIVAIEKHYKLNNKTKSADSSFSITPNKLSNLKKIILDLHKSKKKDQNIEKISKNLRRSIFSTKTIKKNTIITKDNIETLRPNIGICASNYFKILGKRVKKNIGPDQPIFEADIFFK